MHKAMRLLKQLKDKLQSSVSQISCSFYKHPRRVPIKLRFMTQYECVFMNSRHSNELV